MEYEIFYLRFVQIVICINTLILVVSITFARKRNIELHRKLSSIALLTTLVGVLGLVVTILLGWDYSGITTPLRMGIHRSFSVPLFFTLLGAGYFGFKRKRTLHLSFVSLTVPLWLGTLVTGVWFF